MEKYQWKNPFGNGTVAKSILDILQGLPRTNQLKTEKKAETVSVIGLGYMGLPISCLIAQGGYQVTGVDLNKDKVQSINDNICPFDEPGLPELLDSSNTLGFRASNELHSSDIYLVAVPTPHKDSSCDLSYVNSAIDSISKVAKDGQLVIIESTISPRTCINTQAKLEKLGLKVEVVHCPERAIPGQTLHELVNNDRIIGAPSADAFEKAAALYKSFVKGNVFSTDTTTAECVKLVENTSRDVGIAFANELATICDELNVKVEEVIQLANKHPRVNILSPGPGVGGHCIPIDPWFLVENTKSGELVRKARAINDNRPVQIANKLIATAKNVEAGKIALLGVAYKPDVDDCRETPASAILQELRKQSIDVKFYDPYVSFWECPSLKNMSEVNDWADIAIVVTNHTAFQSLNLSIPTFDNCGRKI